MPDLLYAICRVYRCTAVCVDSLVHGAARHAALPTGSYRPRPRWLRPSPRRTPLGIRVRERTRLYPPTRPYLRYFNIYAVLTIMTAVAIPYRIGINSYIIIKHRDYSCQRRRAAAAARCSCAVRTVTSPVVAERLIAVSTAQHTPILLWNSLTGHITCS